MATSTAISNGSSKPARNETVSTLVQLPAFEKSFRRVLGERAPQFISSLLATVNCSDLEKVDPRSVINAAMVAATLDLPIEKNLGYAHIIPYRGRAQFQMGYKGYIQLALRTERYAQINDVVIPANVLVKFDPVKGELVLDWSKEDQNLPPDGYVCYFRLLSGFEKTVFWTRAQVEQHGEKYAPNYSDQDSLWQRNFNAMGLKTVIKTALSRYGILSVQLRQALTHDTVELPSSSLVIPEKADTTSDSPPCESNPASSGDEPPILDYSETKQPPSTTGTASQPTTDPVVPKPRKNRHEH